MFQDVDAAGDIDAVVLKGQLLACALAVVNAQSNGCRHGSVPC